MALELRRGTEQIRQDAKKKKSAGGRFTPFIGWKDGETRTVLFLTPAQEIAKVRLHRFVRIPDDSERGFHYNTLVCRKDPAFREESGNTCQLCDEVGHEADERYAAIALELEPEHDDPKKPKLVTGLRVAYNKYTNREGVEVEDPRWGLVLQVASNFFSFLAAHDERGDIRESAFEIVREGNDGRTKYHFIEVKASVPELDDDLAESIPTLEELVEKLGSLEYYEQELEGVEPQTGEYEEDGSSSSASDEVRAAFDKIKSELPKSKTYDGK